MDLDRVEALFRILAHCGENPTYKFIRGEVVDELKEIEEEAEKKAMEEKKKEKEEEDKERAEKAQEARKTAEYKAAHPELQAQPVKPTSGPTPPPPASQSQTQQPAHERRI